MMLRLQVWLLICYLASPGSALAQATHFFQLVYENDYFTSSDRYYTQGLRLEYGRSCDRPFLLSRLLPRLGADAAPLRSFFLAQDGYTPTNLGSDTVLRQDRPYAGLLYVGQTLISVDDDRRRRVQGEWLLGLIGPWALAGEEQRYIHRQTGNIIPRGWPYQIGNDLLINYQVQYDQLLIAWPWATLSGGGHAALGSYRTRAGLQSEIRLGLRPGAWQPHPGRRGAALYLYGQLYLRAIGYDASLQGGLFRRDNIHTVSAGDMRRGLATREVGVALRSGPLHLQFSRVHIGAEFRGGRPHAWGSCRLWLGF